MKEDQGVKIRIKIKGFDWRTADASCKQIVEVVKRLGGEIRGPVPLPTEIRKYTVNRSTFVHKKSREQFEMRCHKRLIDVLNPSKGLIEALSSLDLPAGINIEIKTIS